MAPRELIAYHLQDPKRTIPAKESRFFSPSAGPADRTAWAPPARRVPAAAESAVETPAGARRGRYNEPAQILT
jgi:hypothetical protein